MQRKRSYSESNKDYVYKEHSLLKSLKLNKYFPFFDNSNTSFTKFIHKRIKDTFTEITILSMQSTLK